MKMLLSLVMLLGGHAYAADYLYKWNKNASAEAKFAANKILLNSNTSINKGGFKSDISHEVAAKLARTGAFDYLESDAIVSAPVLDKNNVSEKQHSFNVNKGWFLDNVNAFEAWKETTGDPSVIVAFCDSGVDQKQSEFRNKVMKGWNFVGNNTNTNHYINSKRRPNTHGTSVAAYIAANFDSANNIGGVAPNVTLLPGLIIDANGNTSLSKISSCIRWAADKGAKVINVSITGQGSKSSWDAAKYAYSKGAVVVWSSGNSNRKLSDDNLHEMIVVGGTDINNNRYRTSNGSYGSNYGVSVDIAAPGQGIYKPWGNHGQTNGTSYSAPIVSGVAALLFSKNPGLHPKEIIEILKNSANHLGRADYFGAGIVDAGAALNLVK